MKLNDLTDGEREVVHRLRAACDGPFFDDVEFHTLFGMDRLELRAILNAWPKVDDRQNNVQLTINNSFANLLGYPHYCGPELKSYVSGGYAEIERIFMKWRGVSARSEM